MLNENEKNVLNALQVNDALTVDQIADQTGIKNRTVYNLLKYMCFNNFIDGKPVKVETSNKPVCAYSITRQGKGLLKNYEQYLKMKESISALSNKISFSRTASID